MCLATLALVLGCALFQGAQRASRAQNSHIILLLADEPWSSIVGAQHIKMVLITESGTTVPGSAGNFYYSTGTLADWMDGTVETYKQRYDARTNQADGTYIFTAGADFNLGDYFNLSGGGILSFTNVPLAVH